jgi:hypothetical protein
MGETTVYALGIHSLFGGFGNDGFQYQSMACDPVEIVM